LLMVLFMGWIVYGWFMILGAGVGRASREVAWGMAAVVSLGAFLINFMLSSLLGLMF